METTLYVQINIDTSRIKDISLLKRIGAETWGRINPNTVRKGVFNELKIELENRGLTADMMKIPDALLPSIDYEDD